MAGAKIGLPGQGRQVQEGHMNTTSLNKLLWLALCGAGVISAIQACSDDESTGTTASPSSSPASSTTGAGGGNGCQGGIDNPCEMCAAAQCTQLALDCANKSMCDANGEPTSGCLLL